MRQRGLVLRTRNKGTPLLGFLEKVPLLTVGFRTTLDTRVIFVFSTHHAQHCIFSISQHENVYVQHPSSATRLSIFNRFFGLRLNPSRAIVSLYWSAHHARRNASSIHYFAFLLSRPNPWGSGGDCASNGSGATKRSHWRGGPSVAPAPVGSLAGPPTADNPMLRLLSRRAVPNQWLFGLV